MPSRWNASRSSVRKGSRDSPAALPIGNLQARAVQLAFEAASLQAVAREVSPIAN